MSETPDLPGSGGGGRLAGAPEHSAADSQGRRSETTPSPAVAPDPGDHQRGSFYHWSRLYHHVYLEGPNAQACFIRLVCRPDVQAVLGYVVREIEAAHARLQRRFEAEDWSVASHADLARAVEAYLGVTHAIHWFLPRQGSPGPVPPESDDVLPLRPNARRLRASLLTLPYQQWPYAVQRWLFLHGLVAAALATQRPAAGGLLPPELLVSCAQELSRFPLHERVLLPIAAMVVDELRGAQALAEFERRVAQRPAALATAWLSLLMRVKSLGLVEAATLGQVEEQLLSAIRKAVAAGKVKVPVWAKTIITRSEGPSFDRRALDGLVDYEIIQTTRARATPPTFSGAFEAVLSGTLDIVPRAVRDRVVKAARGHWRREKVQRLLPERPNGSTRDEGSGAAAWEDAVPSPAAGPEETTVLAEAFARLAAIPGLDVIVTGLVRGDSQEEIAAQLGATARTVRNRIRRMQRPAEP
jgi:hypothetical protein